MKAEHRKELQTNALADRMGRMVRRVKTGPSRRGILWMAVGVVALIGVLWWVIAANNRRTALSEQWMEVGAQEFLTPGRDGQLHPNPMIFGNPGNPELAARFQIAWAQLWELGLRRLAAEPNSALRSIDASAKDFLRLSEECKDDPVLGPEAAYALAVIEETKTAEDLEYLDKAIRRYKGVQSKYPDSAAGKAAGRRAEYLEKNRTQVAEYYLFINQHLGIFARRLLEPKTPPVKTPPKTP
jgi:hypothetical protein